MLLEFYLGTVQLGGVGGGGGGGGVIAFYLASTEFRRKLAQKSFPRQSYKVISLFR